MTRLLVRATINLPGLPAGREALVDPADSYMAAALERGYLVPAEPEDADPDDQG